MRSLLILLPLLASACSYLSEADLSDRMDLDGDGVPRPEDCDDNDTGVRGPMYYVDTDGDGFGGSVPAETCDWAEGLVADSSDCDDTDPEVHPGAEERCNEIDDDCDEAVDEDLVSPIWFRDADGDGHGEPTVTTEACYAPSGYVDVGDDCDDLDAGVNPSAQEVCDDDDVDEDCDELADDDDPDAQELSTVYQDEDGDGYGVEEVTSSACDAGDGWALEAGDCDDTDAELHPDTVWYRDRDEDGYGDPSYTTRACLDVDGYVLNGLDCDDANAVYNPDAQEICDPDDIDEDCDGLVDDADDSVAGQLTIYEDVDGDGYGDDSTETLACDVWSGWGLVAGDCEPSNNAISPAADEVCDDGVDQDCDGDVDCDDPNCSRDNACGYFELGVADARYLGGDDEHVGDAEVAWAGDVSGDGVIDVLIGAWQADSAEGRVYLVDGTHTGDVDLTTDALACFTGVPALTPSFAGSSVASAGDLDGDGFADILVGARSFSMSYSPIPGAAYLFFGPVSGTVSLSTADVTILGDSSSNYVGYALEGLHDVTGDGVADLVVADGDSSGFPIFSGDIAPGTYYPSDAEVMTSWGSDTLSVGGDLDGNGITDIIAVRDHDSVGVYYGPVSDGAARDCIVGSSGAIGDFGRAVSSRGDWDGDGYDDLAVGSSEDATAGTDAGAVHIFLGPLSSSVAATDAVSIITGESAGDGAGYRVELVADVDSDGLGDLVVGAPYNDISYSEAGAAYLVYGPTTGTLSLSDADVYLGGEEAGANAGFSLAADMDLDSDGRNDLLIAAPSMDAPSGGTETDHGAVYLMLGGRL